MYPASVVSYRLPGTHPTKSRVVLLSEPAERPGISNPNSQNEKRLPTRWGKGRTILLFPVLAVKLDLAVPRGARHGQEHTGSVEQVDLDAKRDDAQ